MGRWVIKIWSNFLQLVYEARFCGDGLAFRRNNHEFTVEGVTGFDTFVITPTIAVVSK
jgi:hypothetical protein